MTSVSESKTLVKLCTMLVKVRPMLVKVRHKWVP